VRVTGTSNRNIPKPVKDVIAEAVGQNHRDDPVLPWTGGPAGNAVLTAWTGLVVLGLSLAELVTLLSVHRLIGWHVVIGTLFVPPATLKTASVGWRIIRYYGRDANYRQAGPPPLLLRVLGPGVVLATLGLLASGLVLVALGPEASRTKLISVLGRRVAGFLAGPVSRFIAIASMNPSSAKANTALSNWASTLCCLRCCGSYWNGRA
jgi:hypothetical protein